MKAFVLIESSKAGAVLDALMRRAVVSVSFKKVRPVGVMRLTLEEGESPTTVAVLRDVVRELDASPIKGELGDALLDGLVDGQQPALSI